MRYLVGFLMLIILTSCSKDDDIDKAPDPYILEAIIGSWAYDTVTINGEFYMYQHTEGCVKDMFQFYNEEGKLFDFEEDYVSNCDICAECAISSTNLKWELIGKKIDLYFGEQLVAQYEILEVSDSLIRYKRFFDVDEDGNEDEVEITGVPYDPYDEFD
ncbi:hypothetical protein MWU58_01500 [Flavobacteriaceae bacterium S0825]|uniref:hypothetical protein n=1 Tax=Gaetbulibacter sp. S0825 TaxID=2720084 RepID=UPI00142F99F7|nr:hypothetical protein [Gaetbulibacter sp. S0825]MCK0107957.1 hypothetical protein [Flavobacteriaceae bacterium S0825]NIX63593.1 hypothetical protein [Gaetbulibacter sp. S0825]